MTQKAIAPIISVGGGDIDIFTDVQDAEAYFCYPDAISTDIEMLDSTGRFFLRAYQSDKYAESFELDPNRPPDPDYLADQLKGWIGRTRDRLDYGDLDPDTADLPRLIESVRLARRMGPEPTLLNEIRRIFRRARS